MPSVSPFTSSCVSLTAAAAVPFARKPAAFDPFRPKTPAHAEVVAAARLIADEIGPWVIDRFRDQDDYEDLRDFWLNEFSGEAMAAIEDFADDTSTDLQFEKVEHLAAATAAWLEKWVEDEIEFFAED